MSDEREAGLPAYGHDTEAFGEEWRPAARQAAGPPHDPDGSIWLADEHEPLPAFLQRLDGTDADPARTATIDPSAERADSSVAEAGPAAPHAQQSRARGAEALVVARRRAQAGAHVALREAITLGAVLIVVAAVAGAFVWPWLEAPPIGGERLARYAPLRDGDARLVLQTEGDGTVRGWSAQNSRLIPGLRMYTDLRKAIGDGFMASALRPGETTVPDDELHERIGSLTIQETRIYELGVDGAVTETWQYFSRDERGDRFVGLYYPQTDRDIVADPPALTMPSTIKVGDTWRSEGKLGSGRYTWAGEVLSAGVYDGAAGRFQDCLQVEQRVAIGVGVLPTESITREWYCDGLGWVEGQSLEADGTMKQRTYWLGATGSLPDDAFLPPSTPLTADETPPADADQWKFNRLGRARATSETSEATILPTWVPTDPPILLAAGFAGDLVAFETFTPGAPARWRFHPAGTVYGQPAVDPATGRIYFGASDKHLYALDVRGLFLWSFPTTDNVAARPLVIDDLVVAASEEGKVYGLDATSGRERWTFEAGGGIVSWPLLAGQTIVVGSDDSTVYGIDPSTGHQRWTFPANGAVEAPITLDPESGVAYVASRDGTLAAFRPNDCTHTCEMLWSEEPGGSLRSAPLVAGDRIVVIDQDRELIAVRAEDGKRIWSLGGSSQFVGAPILVDDAIIAATYGGTVERLSLLGSRLGQWDAHTARNPADGEPSQAYGPVLGGDAIWLADMSAVVRRLGAPPLGEIPALSLAWAGQTTRPPFTSSQVRNTVVEYRGQAVVLDYLRGVFLLDPSTGNGSKLTDIPGQGALGQVDPVLAGDTLLTISGRTLQALDLRTGQVGWESMAPGTSVRPPIVSGNLVLWTNTNEGVASMLAVDLASGSQRWQASLGTVAQVGGVVADADTAFTSTPPAAWDLRTGQQRWLASIPGVPLGGPGLAADGRTVYLSGVSASGSTGMVAALDAATGSVRWHVDLEDALMTPLERLWVSDGLVVVPDIGGKVVVLDANSGAERWRFTPPTDRLGGLTVERNAVWFMLENARLYGLDLQSGRPVARLTELELNLNGAGLTQRPAFIGDRLIFPAGLIIVGLDLPERAP